MKVAPRAIGTMPPRPSYMQAQQGENTPARHARAISCVGMRVHRSQKMTVQNEHSEFTLPGLPQQSARPGRATTESARKPWWRQREVVVPPMSRSIPTMRSPSSTIARAAVGITTSAMR